MSASKSLHRMTHQGPEGFNCGRARDFDSPQSPFPSPRRRSHAGNLLDFRPYVRETHSDSVAAQQLPATVPNIQHWTPAGGVGGTIDLTNPGARQLISSILHEFVPLFSGRYWHLGCDEYISDYTRYPQLGDYATRTFGPGAAPGDIIIDFANSAADLVESLGKTPRVWNDGFDHPGVLTPKPGLVVQYWFGRRRWAAVAARRSHTRRLHPGRASRPQCGLHAHVLHDRRAGRGAQRSAGTAVGLGPGAFRQRAAAARFRSPAVAWLHALPLVR
ncbi:family 20 glycosylhydrolase [Nocardia sp. NPDC051981]|uniref:family 20 glycosylhydrolase n=1 Tax=Nocardia sp. NPDC051981 TaxID=3155417 RepID=UPI00342EA5F2